MARTAFAVQLADVATALPEYPELTPAPTYSTNPRAGYGLVSESVTVPGSATTATYTRDTTVAFTASAQPVVDEPRTFTSPQQQRLQ